MARPQAFDTHQALAQALHVFWHKGYEATSLADLLAATGLSKSSLYGTFGSKRELFLAAFDSYREGRAREMALTLREAPARVALERFFRRVLSDDWTCDGEGCMGINQAIELAPHDAEVAQRVQADFQAMEKAFARVIERGQQEGSIPAQRKPADLARVLVVAFPGLQVLVRSGCERSRLDAALRALLTLLD